MKSIVVIGGGIAGLSAAYYLQKLTSGNHTVQITVLEADNHWGGKIKTERIDGFVIEGGPDTFLATKPWATGLCHELGLAERLHGTNPRNSDTFVLHNGRLEPLPNGLTMMIPTQFSSMIRTNLLSWPAKARMGLDFFLPARSLNGDESLGSFVSRRLGRSAYEGLIEPLMSGIYAGDGDQLSLAATFPYLRELELEHGGLVKGALSTRKKMARNGSRAPGSRSAFLTPTTGLAEIVETLVARLKENGVIMQNACKVTRLSRENSRFRVELEREADLWVDGLVLATPAYISGALLANLEPALGRDLGEIPYVSTATISLAYHDDDLPRKLNGYGYIIPRREGRKALACTWTSSKFPHRAPEATALLRVFVGRAGQDAELPTDEEALTQLALEEVRLSLGIEATPMLTRVYYWDQAMPQYNLGHPERLKRIEKALTNLPDLALAGNGYRGIGIPDCIHSGELAALRLVERL